jgi:hypothetical protein
MRAPFPHRLPTLVVNRQAGRYHAVPVTGAACQALDPRLAARVKASYALLPPFEPQRTAQEEAVAAIEVNELCEPTIRRDSQGRFLKRVDASPTATRFPMTDEEIRAAAKRILSHCPETSRPRLRIQG